MLNVREKILTKKEADIKGNEERLKQRESLISIYEKSQVEAQNELDKQNKMLEEKITVMKNIHKNLQTGNETRYNAIAQPYIPNSNPITYVNSFHNSKRFKKTNLKTHTDNNTENNSTIVTHQNAQEE